MEKDDDCDYLGKHDDVDDDDRGEDDNDDMTMTEAKMMMMTIIKLSTMIRV